MHLLSYKYAPLLDLFESDFIDLDNAKDYIPFGEDNLLPQQIVQLSRSVAIHRSILNSKSFYIAGNGFVSENKPLKEYLESVNNYDESLRMQITTKDTTYKLSGSDYYFENDTLICKTLKSISTTQSEVHNVKIPVNNIEEAMVEKTDVNATVLLIGGVLIIPLIYWGVDELSNPTF